MIEIVGAFILAADAIGVVRIRAWSKMLNDARGDLDHPDNPNKNESRRKRGRRWNFFLTLVVTLAATGTVSYFANLAKDTPHVVIWTIALGTGIACAGGVAAAVVVLRVLFRRSEYFLSFVANKTDIKAAGAIGFGLLLIGFVFQLSGIIMQYVYQNSAGV